MQTFIYWSIFTPFYPLFTIIQAFWNFWVVYYASFQSDMLYLLKLCELLISFHINYYRVIPLDIRVFGQDLWSLIVTFNNYVCVLLDLLLFEGRTAD